MNAHFYHPFFFPFNLTKMTTSLLRSLLFIVFWTGIGTLASSQTWTTYPTVNMVLYGTDAEKTIWGTTTYGDQLAFFKDGQQTLRRLPSVLGTNRSIFDMLWLNDTIWVGTDKGLARMTKQDTTIYNAASSAIKDTVKALYHFNNVLYALGPSTLFRYQGGIWQIVKQSKGLFYNDFIVTRDSIFLTGTTGVWKMGADLVLRKSIYYNGYEDQYDRIAIDAHGKIWVSSWWDLFQYGNGVFQYYGNKTIPAFPTAGLEDFDFDSQGNVWMAFGKQGAAALQLTGKFLNYTTANSNIAGDNAHSVLVVDGKVYVGSFQGLSVLDVSLVTSLDPLSVASDPSASRRYSIWDALGKALYTSLNEQEYLETLQTLSGLYLVRIQEGEKWLETKKILR